ncbi:MAG: peptide deformylase [Christensenellaceae bacterium]|jgi:peptide deformylase|nr:peptide deformylase [Christensenellaceae bacterium]
MARLNILKEPNPMLRKIAKPVTEFTPRIFELLDDMTETMTIANGVGLAATQVGILYRMAVLSTKEYGILEVLNPIITAAARNKIGMEACLSVPNVNGKVRRPHLLTIEYCDRTGNKKEITLQGPDAVVACHEIDHLDGILFTDKIVK